MSINRSKFTELVQRAINQTVEGASRFIVRQVAIGPQSNPDLRLRIVKESGLRFSANEMFEVEHALASVYVAHNIHHNGMRRFAKMLRIDFLVSENPSLARSESDNEFASLIGRAVDETLFILDGNPIIKLATLEQMLYARGNVHRVVAKALAFCISRSLVHKVDLKTTSLVNGEDVEMNHEYLVASAARMRVSGSQTDYGLMTLLLAAMSSKPAPKSKRGPKPQHQRNRAIQRRERDTAEGYRRP